VRPADVLYYLYHSTSPAILAFQRLYLFILMSGYATEERRLTFRGSPGGRLVLPLAFYIRCNPCISEPVSFYFNERLRA
ncbi:hypothetical protein, partial [Coprococcus sp. AF99-45]|uniref:hypothetical protein n=1 Tax=Coprococcus sp. AF99-45 TaxID=2997948 RepID=UPI0022E1F595